MTINGKAIVATLSTAHANPAKSAIRKGLPQVLAVMVKNVLLLAYGTTIGYPTILIPGLSGQNKHETFHLNEEQISWISSINMMCVPLGCFFSGVATQPIGRKKAMQIVNFPLIGCWLLFRFADEVWQIYLALALTGLFGGLLEAPVLTYVAEITQPHLRGMLSATSSLSIILGVLFQFLLGTFLDWRTLALVSCVFPVISFCLLLFVPESPHWLVMNNKMDEARRALAWLRGWTTIEDIETEFQELCAHYQVTDKGLDNPAFEDNVNGTVGKQNNTEIVQKSFIQAKIEGAKNFTKKNFLWPLAMVSFIYFMVHFTGSTTLQTYAVQLFATLQSPIDKYYATVFLGVAEFFGCIVCVILVHYAGKRVMAFISITGTGICATVVATYAYLINVKYFNLQHTSTESDPDLDLYKWIPLVFLILLAFVSHCGLRVLPWILIGEIYSKETRATGCGISGAISYIFGFSANKLFLKMVAFLTLPGVYWFYGSLSLLGIIILYFELPETEGKTLQEIQDHFSGLSKLDNKVRRKKISTTNGNVNTAFDDKVPENDQNEHVESRV
ncbi:hypothetical protein ILUMI_04050 [Ignelater luminosus]|uniref:Major facilitator superfamily (MFS) profile domain-containing protein n=1 Tax=Ignelater luminosus TaxID=2038154 RepID=A0A8K0GHQ9_IGNLU|nr:hypothetical protein ILUMI_04050 [Ignelater luminosus]